MSNGLSIGEPSPSVGIYDNNPNKSEKPKNKLGLFDKFLVPVPTLSLDQSVFGPGNNTACAGHG